MRTMRVDALLVITVLAATSYGQQRYPNDGSPLGMNITGITEYGTDLQFFDMFRMFRGWENHGAPDGITPMEQLDEHGWPKYVNPGQELTMGYGNGPRNPFPSGRYLFTWEGEGTFSPRNGCSFVHTDMVNKRIIIRVDSTVAWWGIRLNSTNPFNYARNMRCYLPGFWDESTYRLKPQYSDNDPWHPAFLENLQRFSVLRFMDWLGTNASPVVEWEDFKPATWHTQIGGGSNHCRYQQTSPIWCVRLANRLHAHAWICIPYKASDNCVRRFAELVRDSLNPELNVYVEYGNENWNWAYPFYFAAQYCKDKGAQLGLPGEWGDAYHAYRSIQIWQMFDEVFGAGKSRVKKVLAWQTGNDFSIHFQVIDSPRWNPSGQRPHYLATAPYIHNGTGGVTLSPNLGVETFLDRMRSELVPAHRAEIRRSHQAAVAHGCRLIAYEAGQHLVGSSPALVEFYRQVNRHPKMKDVYLDYMKMFRQETGNGLMAMFGSVDYGGIYGFWGAKEYYNQPRSEAPKYDAMMTLIEEVAGPLSLMAPGNWAVCRTMAGQRIPWPWATHNLLGQAAAPCGRGAVCPAAGVFVINGVGRSTGRQVVLKRETTW